MPVPSPRNKILPVRGNIATLQANVLSLVEGEICYALDEDQYYQKEGGVLVSVGATKAQGALADTALQPSDRYWSRTGTTLSPVNTGDEVNLTRPAGQNSQALTIGEGGTTYLRIKSQGQIQLGGSNVATSPNIQLNQDGSAQFVSNVLLGGTLPSAPNITLNASGTASFAGNVGIGTTSPDLPLTVKSTNGGGTGGALRLVNASTTAGTKASLIFTTTTNETFNSARIDGERDATGTNIVFSSNDFERLRIDSSGRVGIGTGLPGNVLTVKGAVGSNQGIDVVHSNGNTVARLIHGGTGDEGQLTLLDSNSTTVSIRGETGASSYFNAGNVGIGQSNPSEILHLRNSSNPTIRIDNIGATSRQGRITVTTDGNMEFRARSNASDGQFIFYGYGALTDRERMRIDSSGRLLVGTSSAYGNNLLQITGNATSSTSPGAISLGRGLSLGDSGANTNLGILDFTFSNGGVAARIIGVSDGSAATDDYPGRLVFSTTADGSSSPTERMRIKSSGIVNVGNTPVYADNAAAKAGGLVDGDIYRKADGTLMIVYT